MTDSGLQYIIDSFEHHFTIVQLEINLESSNPQIYEDLANTIT